LGTLVLKSSRHGFFASHFKQNDTQRQHLLPHVELVLADANVFEKVVRERIGNVSTVQFWQLARREA
jgi:hypothetical protein